MAVTRLEWALINALSAWRNWSTFSGWQDSGGYIVGLSKDGMTTRWTVLAGLDVIAVWSRLRMARNGDSFECMRGMKDMFVIDGWVRRFVRSKA